MNRDPSVLAIKADGESLLALRRQKMEKRMGSTLTATGLEYKILDYFSASGISAIRYAKEIPCVTAVGGGRRRGTRDGRNKSQVAITGQHQTLIQYAADQATGGGMGATKQMMFNCSMWLRVPC
jgi:hypothetical protein